MESTQSGKGVLYEAFAATAKGLASPKRLELLEHLAQGERSVEALAASSGLRVGTASANLQTLHQAGLVTRRREGARIVYALAGDDVAALVSLLGSVAQRHVAAAELARHALLEGADGDDVPVRHVGRRELLAMARTGAAVVLDVRPAEEFEAGHIPGATSIPAGELAARLAELPAGVEVVAYCRGVHCVMSHDAVRLLRDHGRPAAVLDRGVLEWRASGGPLRVGR